MNVATPVQAAAKKTAVAQSGVIISISPVTGRKLGDVKAAVERVREAQRSWYGPGLKRRVLSVSP